MTEIEKEKLLITCSSDSTVLGDDGGPEVYLRSCRERTLRELGHLTTVHLLCALAQALLCLLTAICYCQNYDTADDNLKEESGDEWHSESVLGMTCASTSLLAFIQCTAIIYYMQDLIKTLAPSRGHLIVAQPVRPTTNPYFLARLGDGTKDNGESCPLYVPATSYFATSMTSITCGIPLRLFAVMFKALCVDGLVSVGFVFLTVYNYHEESWMSDFGLLILFYMAYLVLTSILHFRAVFHYLDTSSAALRHLSVQKQSEEPALTKAL